LKGSMEKSEVRQLSDISHIVEHRMNNYFGTIDRK